MQKRPKTGQKLKNRPFLKKDSVKYFKKSMKLLIYIWEMIIWRKLVSCGTFGLNLVSEQCAGGYTSHASLRSYGAQLKGDRFFFKFCKSREGAIHESFWSKTVTNGVLWVPTRTLSDPKLWLTRVPKKAFRSLGSTCFLPGSSYCPYCGHGPGFVQFHILCHGHSLYSSLDI